MDNGKKEWVSCSQRADYSTSLNRHLKFAGHLTTFCNASGNHLDVWRKNSTKKPCPICASIDEINDGD